MAVKPRCPVHEAADHVTSAIGGRERGPCIHAGVHHGATMASFTFTVVLNL